MTEFQTAKPDLTVVVGTIGRYLIARQLVEGYCEVTSTLAQQMRVRFTERPHSLEYTDMITDPSTFLEDDVRPRFNHDMRRFAGRPANATFQYVVITRDDERMTVAAVIRPNTADYDGLLREYRSVRQGRQQHDKQRLPNIPLLEISERYVDRFLGNSHYQNALDHLSRLTCNTAVRLSTIDAIPGTVSK